MLDKINITIEKYKNKISDEQIFFTPEIPSKKLKNAIEYAQIHENETVLMLIDDTVLGSAKAGMILTDSAIYMKGSGDKYSSSCKLLDIESVKLSNYLVIQKFSINDRFEILFSLPKKKSLLTIVQMLEEFNGVQNKESKSSWTNIGVGAGIGAIFGGPIGAAIGAYIGSIAENSSHVEEIDNNELVFIVTLASMTAKMAKADGVITHDEADVISEIYNILELYGEKRELAIKAFKNATTTQYTIFDYAAQYSKIADDELKEFMYSILWDIAVADGKLMDSEKNILKKIPASLGLPNWKYEQYLNKTEENKEPSEKNSTLKECYVVLNSSPENTLSEIKSSYRKLASEYHPDKIMSKGLSDSFIKFANEQLQTINLAWETIQKHHNN